MGDSRIARVITPKLTTIHYHYKTAGRKAAEIILDKLNNKSKNNEEVEKRIKLNCLLVERKSV